MTPPNILSLHERLCLVRTLTGFPHPITFLITYPSASALPARAALVARLDQLLFSWPHLRARVEGADTNAPCWGWATADERAWTAEDVVSDTPISAAATRETLLHDDMTAFGRTQVVLNKEPSMRVTRYMPDETGAQAQEAYLAVTINHLVTDGVGAARIMQALLLEDSAWEYESGHPPRLEDTIDLIPPASTPTPSTTSSDASSPPWPSTAVSGAPIDYPEGLSLLSIPPDLIARVIAAGKARGVRKLHPILKAAWAAAMRTALQVTAASDLTLTSPRSERQPGVHPYATGNYISRVVLRFTPTQLATIHRDLHRSSDPFWVLAQGIATDLSDPAQQEAGRHTMGRMTYIPNAPNAPRKRTAWEEHYLALARSDAPYGNSATLSNLTYVPLPRGATGLCWAQPACPFSVPFMVSLIGSEAGVSWTTTWREGCVVSREDVKRVERAFVSVLEQVSR